MAPGIHTRRLWVPALLLACMPPLASPEDMLAVTLKPATVSAWNRYLAWADQKAERDISRPQGPFLHVDHLSPDERNRRHELLRAGQIVVSTVTGTVPQGVRFDVPDGEIHHLRGAVLVRDTDLPSLLGFLQDYDHHAGKFEDVEASILRSRKGNHFEFYFRLRRSKSFVTVHYNTEQVCDYRSHGPKRGSSRSEATRIAEIKDAGEPGEVELPPGDDRGFMWRLVSWWRFEEVPEGVIVECESASLSRDIPSLLRWIPGVSAYIRSTPRESLESVLGSIRTHVPKRPLRPPF